ncbi:OmpA family protein [Pseudomonas sp. GL93]|uniref:OmpA family protein n=1 Tax=Pseudomonas sp. GL93 TaxID=2014741 RepID=UPI001402AC28|nr:OmpA family protein [Pseudomonas sp. GL93]
MIINDRPPLAGAPAKVVTTAKGDVYAFSFEEQGRRITCQTPVELDENKKIVTQNHWSLHCTQPSSQQLNQPIPKRELNIPADTLFDFGKSAVQDMKATGRQSVEQLARLVSKEYSQPPRWILTGYTDRIGLAADNVTLGLARAQSVAQVLQHTGIPQDSITVQGKGSDSPVVDCPGTALTPELIRCLQPNRRVAIEVIGN